MKFRLQFLHLARNLSVVFHTHMHTPLWFLINLMLHGDWILNPHIHLSIVLVFILALKPGQQCSSVTFEDVNVKKLRVVNL